ncbi:MAG TPA: FecR domain-containing protein [Chryseosolibacter sp.]|nr:FecR domain-containing protein [Chryseosolibacter sp.]
MAPNIDYRNFSTDDLIKDEFFQRWVYFSDEESNAFWETFLQQNPQKKEEVQDAADFLRLLNFTEEDVFESKIVALKNRVDFTIDHPEISPKVVGRERRLNHGFSNWLGIAATVALVVTASFLLFRNYWEHLPLSTPPGVSQQSTSKGERTILSLEDGTRIWLNVASRIEYPESFDGKAVREVYLEGEAFFDVAENKSKPFVVKTEGVQIKVLGTRFNVKSYHREDQIQTTLVEGKVSIESIDEQPKVVTLAPNQMASYHKESKKLVLNNKTDMDALAGWKDGRLIFDNKPLGEIVLALERWYDVQIHVQDEESLRCHFSAKIENLSLTEVLDLFKASDGIEYRIDGSVVTISGAICEN